MHPSPARTSLAPGRRWQRAARPAVLALLGVALVACSSAPLPETLAVDAPAVDAGAAPGGTAAPLVPGAPGTSTAPGVPGAPGGPTTPGGQVGPGAPGGSSGAPGAPAQPGTRGQAPARSTLFTAAEDRVGITKDQITICAHAALTYGAAFNTSAEDFNVFWTDLNAKGGIFGRKVVATYENDNYTPTDAVTAATACQAKKPFLLLGGIGFDQIPAVRNWAEKERMLYLHHTATEKGSQGLRFSFTSLPSVERVGVSFAELARAKYRTKKIGIIERDSANWAPGTAAFRAAAKRFGLEVVASRKVAINQGNYANEILEMKNSGAEVIFLWENALASVQVLKQAKAQLYNPQWLIFPFNLISQTLGADAMNPPLDGVAMYAAYSFGDRSGLFNSYAQDLALFEKQYAQYRPSIDLKGISGDLLFLNWTGQKSMAELLRVCGPDCTRNRFVDILTSYRGRPTPSACPLDFLTDRRGTSAVNYFETYRAGDDYVNWRPVKLCVGPS